MGRFFWIIDNCLFQNLKCPVLPAQLFIGPFHDLKWLTKPAKQIREFSFGLMSWISSVVRHHDHEDEAGLRGWDKMWLEGSGTVSLPHQYVSELSDLASCLM